MKQTIKIVRPPREFEFNGSALVGIDVTFADSSDGSLVVKPANKEAAHAALEGLKDKEAEFDLEAKPARNGRDQWKIKGYPGKPGGGGFGGGGRQYVDNSPSIEAQNAVNNAVKIVTGFKPEGMALDGGQVRDQVLSAVEWYALRLHALTQSLKNGKASAPAPAGEGGNLPSDRTTPVGRADTWEQQEERIKASGGESRPSFGEGAVSAPPPDLTSLWDEAIENGITKARAVAVLRQAGQPVTSAEDVTESQLESILRPLREKARA
jgi:virulence-associated protein VagC